MGGMQKSRDNFKNDVWYSADGTNWKLATARAEWSPKWLDRGGNRGAGCVVFDGRIWVFGGINEKGMLNDVWSSSDGANWQQATVPAPWKPRGTANSVVFDNKLWIYGGKTGRDEWFAGDVWQMARTQ